MKSKGHIAVLLTALSLFAAADARADRTVPFTHVFLYCSTTAPFFYYISLFNPSPHPVEVVVSTTENYRQGSNGALLDRVTEPRTVSLPAGKAEVLAYQSVGANGCYSRAHVFGTIRVKSGATEATTGWVSASLATWARDTDGDDVVTNGAIHGNQPF